MTEHFDYSWFPRDNYAVFEFLVGTMLGGWLTIQSQSRNNDCFSQFWSMVMNIYGYHKRFDKESTWLPDGPLCLMGFCSTIGGWVTFGTDLSKPVLSVKKIYDTQASCYQN